MLTQISKQICELKTTLTPLIVNTTAPESPKQRQLTEAILVTRGHFWGSRDLAICQQIDPKKVYNHVWGQNPF